MKKKIIFSSVFLILFGFVLFPCFAQSSSTDQRVVGTWSQGEITWVFNANGTGSHNGTEFTYGVSPNGRLLLIMAGNRHIFDCFFSGNNRILLSAADVYSPWRDGSVYTLQKR